MIFENPNIYFKIDNGDFWIRWTLVAFIIPIISLVIYIALKETLLKACSIKTVTWIRPLPIQIVTNRIFMLILIYISTIPIYFFRNVLGDNGNSLIYKCAEQLNSFESIAVILLFIMLCLGITYKNSDTYYNFYMKVLAVLEITYIVTCYITNQVELNQWFNWLGVVILGMVFVALNVIKLKSTVISNLKSNKHAPIDCYKSLFENRKHQADELVDILESSISESGYSICIAGEWGSGKTSLINGVVDKIKNLNKSKSIYEIRINAMELDDINSLINYFFKKIEEILKKNKIYVGVASEYNELINSIVGTLVNESASNFISYKLNGSNSDYRENIEKLNNIISLYLNNSRIVIIIDDAERCSPEKAMSFIFFMKEVATLNYCTTFFLVNPVKLKKACILEDDFFEKFFNHISYLGNVDIGQILDSIKEYGDEAQAMCQKLKEIFIKYDNEIQKAKNEHYIYIRDQKKREEHKNACISSITKNKEKFISDISNPRRLIKAIVCFEMLCQRIERQKEKCSDGKCSEMENFLNKVEYKKQLVLLSLIYGFYEYEFQLIQSNGIYDYISKLEYRFSSESSQSEELLTVDSLIENEWCVLHSYSSDYKYQEIMRFIDCILTKSYELVNISNGYSSLEEKYISDIKQGHLPYGISFYETIDMIYKATYNNYSERHALIKKTFELYAKTLNNKKTDAAFELLSKDRAWGMLSSEIPVLQMFADIFCNENCRIVNIENIKKSFLIFAKHYLWRTLANFSIYFQAIAPFEVTREKWRAAEEGILSYSDYERMLISYCEKSEKYIEFSDAKTNVDAIVRLNNIVDKVNEKYIELEMSECSDVRFVYENAKKAITEIENLFRIDGFINNSGLSAKNPIFNIRDLSIDTLSTAINSFYDMVSENNEYKIIDVNDKYKITNDIERLLSFVCIETCIISPDEYNKLNNITLRCCEINNTDFVANWRHMLVYIFKNKLNKQKDIPINNEE